MKQAIKIREINPESASEVALVARRMRETLVEVLGEEKGTALYSMDWLLARVRWHLDRSQTNAKIFLVENPGREILGHAIARIERDESGRDHGYFSTIFIEPGSRGQGLARELMVQVERWFIELNMPKIVYNTAEGHAKLIHLFELNGYRIIARQSEMVRLEKVLI